MQALICSFNKLLFQRTVNKLIITNSLFVFGFFVFVSFLFFFSFFSFSYNCVSEC